MAYASRNTSYLIAAIGGTIQAIAGWWDIYTHLLFGSVDPGWNPAHLALYIGIAVAALAAWRGLRAKIVIPPMSPVKFTNVGGFKLAVVGLALGGIAGVWNELGNTYFHNELRIAPGYVLLTVGVLIVNLGCVIGLSIEHGMINREFLIVPAWKRILTVACLSLAFSAIWLVAAGSFIYVASVFKHTWIEAAMLFMLATVAMFVFVPAVRVSGRFGTVLSMAIIFNLVALVLLVFYAKAPAYVPFGLIPAASVDFIFVALKRIVKFTYAALIASAFTGSVAYLLYFPFTLFLFPSLFSSGLGILITITGSTCGGMLGNRIYSGISNIFLEKTIRAA